MRIYRDTADGNTLGMHMKENGKEETMPLYQGAHYFLLLIDDTTT
jgi:hypothetical protein